MYVADADAADEVIGVGAESVTVTDTDSDVCADTVGAIVQTFVEDVQPVHEYVSVPVPPEGVAVKVTD